MQSMLSFAVKNSSLKEKLSPMFLSFNLTACLPVVVLFILLINRKKVNLIRKLVK